MSDGALPRFFPLLALVLLPVLLAGTGCLLLTEPLAGGEPRPLLVHGPSPDHYVYRSALAAAQATAGGGAVVLTEGYYRDIAVFTAGPEAERQTVQISVRLDLGGRWYTYDCRPLPAAAAATETRPRAGSDFTRAAFPEIEWLPAVYAGEPGAPALTVLPDDPAWRQAQAGLQRLLEPGIDPAAATHYVGAEAYRAAYYELFSPAARREIDGYAVRGYGTSGGLLLFTVELRRTIGGVAMLQTAQFAAALPADGSLVREIRFCRPRPMADGVDRA